MVWAILGEDYHKAIDEITATDSDRIIAVVGGAMLDDTMRRTLEERLRGNKDMNNKLFKPTGPLGNLGPKIDLAYQLFAFSKEVCSTLYGLSEIRNFLAHHLDASFNSRHQKLADGFKKLTLHTGRTHYPNPFEGLQDSEHRIEPTGNRRTLFLVNLKLCLIYLMADRMSHELNSIIPVGYVHRAAQQQP